MTAATLKTKITVMAATTPKTKITVMAAATSRTQKTVDTGTSELKITVIRSSRKTMTLEVQRSGEVIVRAPLRMPVYQIQQFVKEKEGWIRKHVEEMEKRKESIPQVEPLTAEEMQKLGNLALKVLPERVKLYASQMGVSVGRITIRCQKTRWGSCTREGNLNFNCILMLAPEAVQNYVVVHELCHRLEMNHSKRFWAEVAKVMPDYKIHQKWLKENGSRLMARRPE